MILSVFWDFLRLNESYYGSLKWCLRPLGKLKFRKKYYLRTVV